MSGPALSPLFRQIELLEVDVSARERDPFCLDTSARSAVATSVCTRRPKGTSERDKGGIEDLDEGGGAGREGRDDLFVEQTIS